MHPITIHRRTEKEINQAVDDLLKRGFELISPITNIGEWGKDFEYDTDMRPKLAGYKLVKSYWIAKMKKVSES